MERSYIGSINKKLDGKKILVKGWVSEIRDLGKVQFVLLRDKTGLIQCVSHDKELKDKISKISPETVVEIDGKVKESKVAKKGYEIQLEKINVLSESGVPLPIDTSNKTQTHKN